jgi:hypothetical protein
LKCGQRAQPGWDLKKGRFGHKNRRAHISLYNACWH